MTGVDHQAAFQPRCARLLTGLANAGGIIVGAFAAPQNHVTVFIATGGDDCRMTTLGHRQEVMRLPRGLDRVERDFQVAIGTILEAHRA